MVTACAAFA